jgi:hypothetical protein
MILEGSPCPPSCPLCAMCSRWSLGAGDARRAGCSARATHNAQVARRGRHTTRRSLGMGDARRAGRSARATHDAQVAAMSSWRLLGATRVFRARRDVLALGRSAGVTHDAQVAAMSSWRLLPGSFAHSSCPPRCARVRSLGAGDARRAGRRDVVVAAAPWELRALFVPAVMCPRLVARHGRRALRAGRWRGLAVTALRL